MTQEQDRPQAEDVALSAPNPAQMTDASTGTVSEGGKRTTLLSASAAHVVHDGTHDAIYVLLPLWAEAFGLSYAQVGLLKSAFAGALAIFQMPAGMLSERIGERMLLVLGTLIMGFAFALTALAGEFWLLLCLLFAGGMASSVQHPLGSSLVSAAYTQSARRGALGIYNFSGDIGKMCGAFSIGIVAGGFGWQTGTMVHGIVVMCCAGVLYVILARLPQTNRQVQAHSAVAADRHIGRDWGFTDKSGFAVLSVIKILDSVCRTGLLTFVPFVLIGKGATAAGVGIAVTLLFVGGAIGKLVCGFFAARVGIIRTVVVTELLAAVLIVAVIPASLTMAFVLLVPLGIMLNGTSSVLYGTVGEFVREDRQARAFGLFYTLGSAASTVSPIALGIVSDMMGVESALVTVSVLSGLIAPVALLLRPHLQAA